MSVKNILEVFKKPHWAIQTLVHGQPAFKTLEPYMPKGLNMKKLGEFMDATFSGRLSEDRIASIRDQWKGKLVIKGVVSEEDEGRQGSIHPESRTENDSLAAYTCFDLSGRHLL